MSTSGLRCPGAKWQREDPANVLGSVWASLNISHDVDRELLCTGLIPCHGHRETLQITPRQQQQGLSTLYSPLAKSVFSKAPGRQGAGPEGRSGSTMGDLPRASSRILLFTQGGSICSGSIPVPGSGSQGQDAVPIAQDSSQAPQCGNPGGSPVNTGDALEASRHISAHLNKELL